MTYNDPWTVANVVKWFRHHKHLVRFRDRSSCGLNIYIQSGHLCEICYRIYVILIKKTSPVSHRFTDLGGVKAISSYTPALTSFRVHNTYMKYD